MTLMVNGMLPAPMLMPSGSKTVPTYSFAAGPTFGWYYRSGVGGAYAGNSGKEMMNINTSGSLSLAGSQIGFNSSGGDLSVSGTQAVISADLHAMGMGMELNGQFLFDRSLTELTTIAAAAFTDTTIQIPAGCQAIGVSVRVTVVVPTATAFDVGVAGATTRYATGVLVAATTTNPGMADGVRYYASAISIRITPDVQPADNTGRVRVTIHYKTITPPTS